AYPPHLSHSTLTLPPFRRAVHGPAYLIFWHWYDTEHLGHADPHRPDSTDILFDGGNLKFSTDGGSSWNLLRPESGYPGTVSDRFENPLGGEPAFGGFSNGWRRVVAALPEADELIIRFEFATDEGNTESGVSFAGWLLDQVSIVTELPEDAEPPRFERLPARVMTAATTAAAVPIEVTAADDIGIESIRMCYELLDHQGAVLEQDTVFFQMSSESASTYRLDFRPSTELRPAYRVRYQLAARDFNGNERWSSASGKDFWIDYVHVETVSALEGLRRTGLWARHEGRWVTARRLQTVEYSSLVMGPFDLPAGTESISLHLDHEHAFGSGVGGNLKVSDDDGETWTVIMPEGGYGAEFPSGSHFMAEEPIFNGASGGRLASTFDLSHLDGGQIRLRLDYGATRPADDGEWWSVRDLQLTVVALDDNLPIPRETRLHTNYPDPFSTTTTISYTISEQDAVLLEVYDVLGRRIDVLVWAIQAPGTYTLSYDGSRLAGGVYFLRMTSGETQEVEKMVVSR
ncbi:MAG: T9SS type A sorting domain-containing protein, partial [Bacteroidota bacterium]